MVSTKVSVRKAFLQPSAVGRGLISLVLPRLIPRLRRASRRSCGGIWRSCCRRRGTGRFRVTVSLARLIWLWLSKPFWIPFWLGLVNSPPIVGPILVGIGMFIGGTIWVLTHGNSEQKKNKKRTKHLWFQRRTQNGLLQLCSRPDSFVDSQV